MEANTVILSDSDEDYKPFGTRSKKRKMSSNSEDEYKPPSRQRTKKIKKANTNSVASEKPTKHRATLKERRPKTETKRTVKKTKSFKEENKNEVCICHFLRQLDVDC
jgi:hypothetical protein